MQLKNTRAIGRNQIRTTFQSIFTKLTHALRKHIPAIIQAQCLGNGYGTLISCNNATFTVAVEGKRSCLSLWRRLSRKIAKET